MLPTGTPLGELTIDEVFVDYDGPQLFSSTSDNGLQYLAVHAPPTERMDNWLYVRVSVRRLEEITRGFVTLRNAFAKPDEGGLWLVSFEDDGRILTEAVSPSMSTRNGFRHPVSAGPGAGDNPPRAACGEAV